MCTCIQFVAIAFVMAAQQLVRRMAASQTPRLVVQTVRRRTVRRSLSVEGNGLVRGRRQGLRRRRRRESQHTSEEGCKPVATWPCPEWRNR